MRTEARNMFITVASAELSGLKMKLTGVSPCLGPTVVPAPLEKRTDHMVDIYTDTPKAIFLPWPEPVT